MFDLWRLTNHGSMSDEEFYAFLTSCRDELAIKQAALEKRIASARRWHYEMTEASLDIGETKFGMTPIALIARNIGRGCGPGQTRRFPKSNHG